MVAWIRLQWDHEVEASGSGGLDVNYERTRGVKNASFLVVWASVEGRLELPFSEIQKADKK